MSTPGHDHGELRIGGWLPPSGVERDDGPVTEVIPAVPDEPAPDGAPVTLDDAPPVPAPPAPRRGRRGAAAAVAVTTLAVAAGVPLLLSTIDEPERPDRQVLPAPSVAPSDPPVPLLSPDPPPSPSATPTAAPTTARPTATAASRAATRSPAPATSAPRRPAPETTNAAPRTTISVEAEGNGAVRTGGANPRPVPGASGGTVIAWIGWQSTVRFTGLDVPAAGRYDLVVHYVCAEPRSATIRVNGERVGRYDFPATGGWETVKTMTVRLPLAAGPNTVEISNPDTWAPDLDRVTLTR